MRVEPVAPTAATFTAIPRVSLGPWRAPGADRAAFAREVRDICHNVGFFTLVDHGVDDAFLTDWMDAVRAFFALREEVKPEINNPPPPPSGGGGRGGADLPNTRAPHREQSAVPPDPPPPPPGWKPPYLRLDGPN